MRATAAGAGIVALTCTLSGPTSFSGACDAPTTLGKGSTSGAAYSGLANGSYTFSVSLLTTDGGTASATSHFTVSVVAGHIYWTDVSTHTIGRANLDGSGVNQSFISGASTPFRVAVDASHVYWTNTGNGTIGRANLDGSSVDQSFIIGALNSEPSGLALDGSYLYWTNYFYVISGLGSPTDVVVTGKHVYWTEGFSNRIGRANLDGTGVDENFIIGLAQPWGLTIGN